MFTSRGIENLALVLTAQCNLRCSYCYQNAKQPKSMPWETLRSSLDFALGSRHREAEILFLGGEPFLEFPLMRGAVEYIDRNRPEKKCVTFSVGTNGTLLTDEMLEFMEEHRFNLQLSFDGIDKAQDLRGRDTFEILDHLLDRLREEHPDFFRWNTAICVTVTPQSAVHLPASIDYFLVKGVQRILLTPSVLSYPSWRIKDIGTLDAQFDLILERSIRHWKETGKIPVLAFRNKFGNAPSAPGAPRERCEPGAQCAPRELDAPEAPRDRPMCGVVNGLTLAVDVNGQAYACTTLADSYQEFPSPFMREGLRGMCMGNIADSDFVERHASFAETARGVGMFNCKANKYSSYGRCAECAYFAMCLLCPVSIAHVQGSTDRDRVSDFCCAFYRALLGCRERFPNQRSPRECIQGPPGAAAEMQRWKALAEAVKGRREGCCQGVAVKHAEGMFQGVGGLPLHGQCWHPEQEPRAVVGILHGHGEHSGRYLNVVHSLLSHGYAVCAFDHRGHGRSRGQRGHISSWSEYREDVRHFLQWVSSREPDCPIFLMGHSMGALVALDYLIHYSKGIRGAIISGAPIEPAGVAKPYLVLLSRLLSRVFPRFPLHLALDTSALSRDAAIVRAYVEDPLVHGKFSARWGTESLATLAWVKAHAADLDVPILFIHGEADRLNLPDGSRHFFERISSADKTIHIYPEMYHELHNDLGYDQVMNDLEQWLRRHQ
jgi:alpha-beta hydrolase superfamily lysophospholipase/sulfatase maturation enzyme AslB (radical SAM superfamily)